MTAVDDWTVGPETGNRLGNQVDDPEVWTAPLELFWVPGHAPFWVLPCILVLSTRWLGTVSPTRLFRPNSVPSTDPFVLLFTWC